MQAEISDRTLIIAALKKWKSQPTTERSELTNRNKVELGEANTFENYYINE
jgi:hypothetical protein